MRASMATPTSNRRGAGRGLRAGVLGHDEQAVDGQQRPRQTQPQPLRHRAGGAQAREGAGAAAEGHGVQVGQRQPRLRQQAVHLRQQRRRGRRTARGQPGEPGPVAALQGQRQLLGGGVESQQAGERRRHCRHGGSRHW